MNEELIERFNKAVKFLSNTKVKVTNDQQLYFYGHYKQATIGKCNTKCPSFFDFVGKAKWNSWSSLGDLDKDTSMNNYIDQLNKLVPNWLDSNQTTTTTTTTTTKSTNNNEEEDEIFGSSSDEDESSKSSNQNRGMGPTVSRFSMVDDETIAKLNENQKEDLSYWVTMDNKEKVLEFLEFEPKGIINEKDEEGRTPLMWSCDRGLIDMTKLLIERGSNLNLQDNEGQTPLHYACLCTHQEIIQLLLNSGADKSIVDHLGSTPLDLIDKSETDLISILNSH
eukprot:gene909-1138_t